MGSSVGGTTFTQPLLMIGVSEYSTANLTNAGLRLIENAIYYLLDMNVPAGMFPESPFKGDLEGPAPCRKYLLNGQLIIERDSVRYDISGKRL